MNKRNFQINVKDDLLHLFQKLDPENKGVIPPKYWNPLLKLLKNDREKYEKFFKNFGLQLKYGIYQSYGMKKDMLQDLLLFYSYNEDKMITLKEYVEAMKKLCFSADIILPNITEACFLVDEEDSEKRRVYFAFAYQLIYEVGKHNAVLAPGKG